MINPAAFTHTSVAIWMPANTFEGPVIEIHISTCINARASGITRSASRIAPMGSSLAWGLDGYQLALRVRSRNSTQVETANENLDRDVSISGGAETITRSDRQGWFHRCRNLRERFSDLRCFSSRESPRWCAIMGWRSPSSALFATFEECQTMPHSSGLSANST